MPHAEAGQNFEYPGATYHVMCRGDRREAIFEDDQDRECFVETLAQAAKRAGWLIHAYVLMGNHYHLLLETPEPNLVRGMTWFQTTYAVRYNVRHRSSGTSTEGATKRCSSRHPMVAARATLTTSRPS